VPERAWGFKSPLGHVIPSRKWGAFASRLPLAYRLFPSDGRLLPAQPRIREATKFAASWFVTGAGAYPRLVWILRWSQTALQQQDLSWE